MVVKIRLWPENRWLRAIILLLAVLLLPYCFSRFASPWRRLSVHSTHDAEQHNAPTPTAHLRIACYNIAHGRGIAASNWDGGNRAQRIARLDRIADLLRKNDADIVVLNEVDFDSSWSHSTNQARYLAEKADYPYWAEQRNLDFRILMWTWRFGNAVLSKYPITNAQVANLPSYSRRETVFAGKKCGVICDIRVGDHPVRIIGAHLSHRSESVRVRSAAILVDIADESSMPTIVAGDMNSTPSGFPNAIRDPNGDNAIDTFDRSECFQRLPKNPPVAASDLTFSSVEPRSVIDWILIPHDWNFLQYTVQFSELSDHCPVYAEATPPSD